LEEVVLLANPSLREAGFSFASWGGSAPPYDIPGDVNNPWPFPAWGSNSTLYNGAGGYFNIPTNDAVGWVGQPDIATINLLRGSGGVVEMYLERTGAYSAGEPNLAGTGSMQVYWTGTDLYLYMASNIASIPYTDDPMPLNEVVHWAFLRGNPNEEGQPARVFRNGELLLDATSANALGARFHDIYLGFGSLGFNFYPNYSGRLYGLRMTAQHPTLGIRYANDASFTPPALPFPETL
jgi:hypothetical protein